MNKAALTTSEDQPSPPAIISVIERAASDPNVSMDKMERLLEMQERIMDRQAKADFTVALAEMQPELPVTVERGEIKNNAGNVQSTFPKWEDISDDIRPVLHKYGFKLNFRIENLPDGKIVVYAMLSCAGHDEETPSPAMAADTSGSKNAIQAQKSTVSYGKRIAAQAILNLTSRGEDDDGQAGGAGPTITPEQFIELRDMLEELGDGDAAFLKHYRIPMVEQLPEKKFADAVDIIKDRLAKKTKGGE